MTPDQISKANAELRNQSPLEIVRWAVGQANGRAIVSTNFRPYEAVILHLCVQVQPDIPVLWVDHGYNCPATYKHAEELKKLLKLNLKPFVPKMTAAHYDAAFGGPPEPTPGNEERIKAFSAVMKLEPFQRGMKELSPAVWLTALRKVQNPNRAGLDIVSEDKYFGALKVSPVYYLSDADMETYLKQHNLPNEWDYFDPAKADDKRECGLHANWGSQVLGSGVWALVSVNWINFMGEPFENSEAWKSARVLVNEVYSLCRREPLCRDFGLRDQLQRAAISVMNNITEGWESLHVAEKRQAYNIARRSCGEVRSMSYPLLDNKFISTTEQTNLQKLCILSGKLISGLIRSLNDR